MGGFISVSSNIFDFCSRDFSLLKEARLSRDPIFVNENGMFDSACFRITINCNERKKWIRKQYKSQIALIVKCDLFKWKMLSIEVLRVYYFKCLRHDLGSWIFTFKGYLAAFICIDVYNLLWRNLSSVWFFSFAAISSIK